MIVDFHTHMFSPDLPDLWAETGDPRWPRLVTDTRADDSDEAEMRRGEHLFRIVRRPFWDVEARVAAMDAFGHDIQVVSPIPVALAYWADADLGLRFARAQNERIAEAVAASSGRLIGLGTVPLQQPALAADEMVRLVGELGLAGVEIGTVVPGPSPDDPRRELDDESLLPFFSAAAEHEVPLFLHPTDGSGALRCSDPQTDFAIGMHSDSALAIKSLVYGSGSTPGLLERFPTLRVCCSHGGGSFPWTHPRLRFWAGRRNPEQPAHLDTLVRRLWADTLTFDDESLGVLVRRYGADHLVLGSDYPFIPPPAHDPRLPLRAALEAGVLTSGDHDAISGPNALAFLKRA